MKKLILILALFVTVSGPVLAQNNTPLPTDTDIEKLDWMLGTWKGQLGNKTYVERWYRDYDGTIRGIGHYVANHDSTLAEVLVIQPIGDKLVYIAYPMGQTPTMFVFTEVSRGHFEVTNPEHDFPQSIGYKKQGDDSLVAIVGGGGKSFTVRFTRIGD